MSNSVKVTAANNKNNYLELKPNVTRRDIAEYNEAVQLEDAAKLEAVIRRTVLDAQLVIDGEKVKGLDDIFALDGEAWDTAEASTFYFWQRAWLVAFNEAQKLGNPTRRG